MALFEYKHATRLGAIFLITSLALYSNNAAVYFATVFILASAVTELAFLEKLAAIIRVSKEYFDYMKSQIPIEEAKEKAG